MLGSTLLRLSCKKSWCLHLQISSLPCQPPSSPEEERSCPAGGSFTQRIAPAAPPGEPPTARAGFWFYRNSSFCLCCTAPLDAVDDSFRHGALPESGRHSSCWSQESGVGLKLSAVVCIQRRIARELHHGDRFPSTNKKYLVDTSGSKD